jgi:signal peptidase I
VTDTAEGAPPQGDDAAPAAPAASARRRSTRNAVEWVGIVVGALVVALVVKTFLIQAFFIPSLSMYSTLDKGDRVLVNKLSYHLHDIHRGDIVVFERPPGVEDLGIKDLIKRVVAVGGDTVETRKGHVYVNGRAEPASYLDDGVAPGPDVTRQTIAKGHIFVMGDNRGNSQDSRVFGPIDDDLVVGRAFVRIWPLPDLRML